MLKKSQWKRKPTKPLKRGTLRKQGKQKISVVQRKLWELCKQIIRIKYPPVCYTCEQTNLSGSNLQTGHVPWPKASLGAYQKYDLNLLRIQCARCNLFLGGMGAVAYQKMLKEIGPKAMQKLQEDRRIVLDGFNGRPKAMDHYLKLISSYQKTLESLEAKLKLTN